MQGIPAQEALDKFRESTKNKLESNDTTYLVATLRDTHTIKDAGGNYNQGNMVSVKELNKELWEPM